ncbi:MULTISPECIES: prolipoprotein diacylglyceryl transferase [Salegentibacter]|uniref:Phosphatidylglycerol--prolipoprotein diacylglyceryl transferase n=1 Tax=Salegentibacter agarivorans TaxID=345907 RepID=A0A1I2KYB6_9FLAO|nr:MULTISPECIES: prolipoprotein diacylglyceryl transferase [Salegentibacter]SFF71348.1 prolipoprotein diacylglyceryl transferase [Salegentibacter agarivorans]
MANRLEDNILYWDTDPVILWITENFPLKYYGLLFMTGLFLGYFVVKHIYKKEKNPTEQLDSLLTYIVLGTIIGARLGHCLFYEPSYYLEHPIEMFLPIKEINGNYQFIGFQGLASHGGAIGVLLAIVLYCRKYNLKILWVLDRVAIATPITGAFIRFGNFMNSEIYGKPTSGTWGVVFQRDDLIPRHPTQLYEAFSYLVIFVILYAIYKTKTQNTANGVIFGLFLILLFLARFIIEFFKENQVAFENQMVLNMGQLLSIPFMLIGAIIIITVNRKKQF